MNTIQDIFKTLKKAKCSQREIAKHFGLQETFVSSVKRGESQLPLKYFKEFYKLILRNGLKISHEKLFDIFYEKK